MHCGGTLGSSRPLRFAILHGKTGRGAVQSEPVASAVGLEVQGGGSQGQSSSSEYEVANTAARAAGGKRRERDCRAEVRGT